MTDKTQRPAAVIKERFPIRGGNGITVQAGINPEKGALTLYGYWDKEGTYHSFGQFPLTRYPNQLKQMATWLPTVLAFVTADESSETPRLSYKRESAQTKIGTGVDVDTNTALIDMLVAGGMSREEAEVVANQA